MRVSVSGELAVVPYTPIKYSMRYYKIVLVPGDVQQSIQITNM